MNKNIFKHCWVCWLLPRLIEAAFWVFFMGKYVSSIYLCAWIGSACRHTCCNVEVGEERELHFTGVTFYSNLYGSIFIITRGCLSEMSVPGLCSPMPSSRAEHMSSRRIQKQNCKIRLLKCKSLQIKFWLDRVDLCSRMSFKIHQPNNQVVTETKNAQHTTHLGSVACLVSLPVPSTGEGCRLGAVFWWQRSGLSGTFCWGLICVVGMLTTALW